MCLSTLTNKASNLLYPTHITKTKPNQFEQEHPNMIKRFFLPFTTIAACVIFWSWTFSSFKDTPHNTTNNITVDAIADYVIEMPESPFKKNMLTVFGAEYAGDSTELNKLLNAYSTMKLEEMEKLKGKTL